MPSLLAKDRIIAPPGYNRWLVPPAALAIHLSIGMAYGFSVFWLPLSKSMGVKVSQLGWVYTLFFVFLGSSAALFGPWLERVGPRKAGVVAACCWGGGFFLSALGVYLDQLWLLWVGAGVIGGCGLGLGYISPVSTLIKWFPDRRGMATGLAIMGFGGGALIGAPLANFLMHRFATATSPGVMETFLVMGTIYSIAMMCGAFGYRLPPPGWIPAGWTPPPPKSAPGWAQAIAPIPSSIYGEAERTRYQTAMFAYLLKIAGYYHSMSPLRLTISRLTKFRMQLREDMANAEPVVVGR